MDIQGDQWKLILVLSLSLGLGVSCCLLLCILRLCRLHSDKVTKPRAPDGEMKQKPRIDLDSESVVDYDINTALYTPLPEPRIMQVSNKYVTGRSRPSFNKVKPKDWYFVCLIWFNSGQKGVGFGRLITWTTSCP